jgi:hypothetical protein
VKPRFQADADLNRHIVSAAAEELLLIWFASEADEWTNQIASLPL